MSQSLAQVYLHLIFSTKHRVSFLRDELLRSDLYGYMAGICRNVDCPTLRVGGVEDHVHLLVRFGRQASIANLIRDLKRDSSKWLKEQDGSVDDFHWQAGYGAFSISPAHVDALCHYIETQVEHHRYESFQDEFRRICEIYDIEIDERYVWD